jgi:hypothetical protein
MEIMVIIMEKKIIEITIEEIIKNELNFKQT